MHVVKLLASTLFNIEKVGQSIEAGIKSNAGGLFSHFR